ncbi:unnamed protein product [Urochloa decumbens]|uniref:Methyltransferase PMT26 n=1 Tax=Urochloa decumbens TaxID=240449 RepID=A0ABC9GPH7_9POAL
MPLFERDRYQRLDGGGGGAGPGRRPPSSFCSSATIVFFVALCLVAAWMMASSNNIAVNVSPENKSSEAKDLAQSDRDADAVSDTPQTTDATGAEGGGATQTSDEAGSAGDTSSKDDDKKDDGAAETADPATSNDASRSDVAETVDVTANSTGGVGTVAEGESAAKNQTSFSDENGKTEGGEVAKPEDPDKKVEQSAEQATADASNTTSTHAEKSTDDDTGGKADKNNGEEGSTSDADSAKETPTESEETGGGAAKNQTAFDDAKVNSDEAAGSDKAETTDDDTTSTTSSASKNATSGGQNQNVEAAETTAYASGNGTVTTPDTDTNSSANSTSEEETRPSSAGDGAEELLPSGGQAELLNETSPAANGAFPTQAAESSNEKKKHKNNKKSSSNNDEEVGSGEAASYRWKLCNTSTGADYIPCLDNEAAIRKLKTNKHYEHRERHCPTSSPSCLVPLPEGYRQPIPWPYSRDKIWYHNVPHAGLASYKGHQNWVKVSGEHLTFPGGGTQFKHGAAHYIELIGEALPEVAWGRRSRVVLDVGCGVASFGGFLFDRDALTMSFAPKDEHEAQVQFALERGIPAISAVMGTKRLPFPGNAFDAIHCARCRVPWHIEGGTLLLEANRLLRPGGLFVWSATPVYRKVPEDVQIWHAMAALTKSMCWEMMKRTSDTVDQTAMVIFKKPTSNDCYDARARPEPPMCEAADDQDAAWNVTLQPCMHRVPTDPSRRGSQWPAQWPDRLAATPYWLSADKVGVYGNPAPADFAADQEHWSKVVQNSYLHGLGIDWKNVRNVMDMRAVYGGFAAALRDMKVWVMNVVTIDSPDTLPIIYERGLFGMYHDWCESFSAYPRSYDLVHADHLFSMLKSRCNLLPVVVEVDRILRPEGKLIVHDDMATVEEVKSIARSLHWEVRMSVSKQGEGLLCVSKTMWRPTEVETLS